MAIVIETSGLTRVYQSYQKQEGIWNSVRGFWDRQHISKIAVKDVNLKIESGQIIGLVGANGAGKTTLLKILSGLITPTSGDATVLGFKPWQRKSEYLKKISILLGQKNQLWWDLSPLDSYSLLARIYDLDLEMAKKRVQELAYMLRCEHVLQTQLRRLSLGERMKMEIIGALLHEPEVLFLDEPTIGLDIVAQTTIREFLHNYVKNQGPTVILTSHYMDDIARLAHQLLLMSQGEIVYSGTVEQFIEKAESKQQVTFRFIDEIPAAVTVGQEFQLTPEQKEYSLKVSAKQVPFLLGEITRVGHLQELKIEQSDFEDVIRSFLEKESRVF
jgi:ABC-2 type transport system ATP-binding protein